MKKIFLLITVLALSSCSKDDNDCKCTGQYANFDSPGFFFVQNVPINCETKHPVNSLPNNENAIFVKCVED
jgi:hypothetical protein